MSEPVNDVAAPLSEAPPAGPASPAPALVDRLYAPVWAGGWTGVRLAFGTVSLLFLLSRAPALADAYAAQDMVFANWPFFLADHVRITLRTAWLLWGAGVLGLVGVLAGGRWMRPGLLLWLVADWVLLAAESLNIKAHDRLGLWIALGLLLSPAAERGLGSKWRSPASRWYLMVVYAGIYGSTGWLKLLEEPGWWSGKVLAYHLVHRYFGGGALGAWVSGQPWLVAPMGWATVLFEVTFPLLVWSRRLNPWLLALGASFHLGIAAMMNVGPFSWVALSAYPVLLHPDVARRIYERARGFLGRRGAA
ncbi:MAG: HTTM domain-containing protein [Pseudomonadota bacterium]|nr:HTTM domain-containing protein [Pseudomonadota bacterium]